MGANGGTQGQEQRYQPQAPIVRGVAQIATHHRVGEVAPIAMYKVHEQKGEVVQPVDDGDVIVEFDRVEQRRYALNTADVAQVQVAMQAPHMTGGAARVDQRRIAGKQVVQRP